MLCSSQALTREAACRARAATAAYMDIPGHFWTNPAIERRTKLAYAEMFVFSRLFLFTSTWDYVNKAVVSRMHVVYLRVLRKILGAFRSAEGGWTDAQVCFILGVPSVECRMRRGKLMLWARLCRLSPPPLRGLLQAHGSKPPAWLVLVRDDLNKLRVVNSPRLDALAPASFQHGADDFAHIACNFQAQWRTFVGRIVSHADSHLVDDGAELVFECPTCSESGVQKSFKTLKGLKVHFSKAHGIRMLAREFVDSCSCPVCGKVFASRARAVHHAEYSSSRCSLALARGEVDRLPDERIRLLDEEQAAHRLACRKAGRSYL